MKKINKNIKRHLISAMAIFLIAIMLFSSVSVFFL